MIDLYLIRHALCEDNLHPEIISGGRNSSLVKRGIMQSFALRERLIDEQRIFDEAYSSQLERARMTASYSICGMPRKGIILLDELKELEQGEWAGRVRTEVYTPEVLRALAEDNWNFAPPGGESQRQAAERMNGFINKYLLEGYDGKDKAVGVYGHGNAFKCLLADLLGFDKRTCWKIPIDNASITQLRYENGIWIPLRINDAGHIHSINRYLIKREVEALEACAS